MGLLAEVATLAVDATAMTTLGGASTSFSADMQYVSTLHATLAKGGGQHVLMDLLGVLEDLCQNHLFFFLFFFYCIAPAWFVYACRQEGLVKRLLLV